ncbi:MAG: MBL fold metallo-hydrolase [Dongiaceae bacterium]
MINRSLALIALALLLGVCAAAQALELKVFSGPGGFGVTSTLVIGKDEVIVIDAQYVRSDAHRLVAELLETRKRVSTVFFTHSHPDHVLGSEVLAKAFPEARFVAKPEVVDAIKKLIPAVLARPGFKDDPNNVREPVIPAPLAADSLTIDGEQLEILSNLTGDDAAPATAVYIPSLKSLIAGDVVFESTHLWTGSSNPAVRRAWIDSVKGLEAMRPAVVVAGHRAPNGTNSPAALAFTREYLEAFDAALSGAANADELFRRLTERYPNLAYPPMLRIGARRAYPSSQ